MKFNLYQIVENHLPNNKGIRICKIVEYLKAIDEWRMVAVHDYDEYRGDVQILIAKKLTWTAPESNIQIHDIEYCHVCEGE